MPWEALKADLEPSVRVALFKSESGPPFLAGISGAASAHQLANTLWEGNAAALGEATSASTLQWQHPDPKVSSELCAAL
jgi:hypothetical protein